MILQLPDRLVRSTTVTPDATLETPNTFGVGVTYKYDKTFDGRYGL